MPSKSPAQHRLMEAAAHTKGGYGGVPQRVGREFVSADKGKSMSINIKPSHKGLLHKKLGVPQGKPIPAAKVTKAEHSKSPALRKEAQFAENAKHFNHPKGGKGNSAEARHPRSHNEFLALGHTDKY